MQYTMTSPARERGTESEYKEATATSALILGFAPKDPFPPRSTVFVHEETDERIPMPEMMSREGAHNGEGGG